MAALLGYFSLAGASGNLVAAIQAFAAGAILTILASTMMPEVFDDGGQAGGHRNWSGNLALVTAQRATQLHTSGHFPVISASNRDRYCCISYYRR